MSQAEAEELSSHHRRIRERGITPWVYWPVRAFLQPFLTLYFRLRRAGRAHVPPGPVLLAADHRSFLDPVVIGCCVPRPIYFMAKRELFDRRVAGWFLNALGAFPVRRGESDEESMATARILLERGEGVLIFPEGARHRSGPLHPPRRGVGRLALQTGAPIVPVAIKGTERARRGWLIRPGAGRHAVRSAAHLPARRGPFSPSGQRGHRPHLAVRRVAVGLAGRRDARAGRGA